MALNAGQVSFLQVGPGEFAVTELRLGKRRTLKVLTLEARLLEICAGKIPSGEVGRSKLAGAFSGFSTKRVPAFNPSRSLPKLGKPVFALLLLFCLTCVDLFLQCLIRG